MFCYPFFGTGAAAGAGLESIKLDHAVAVDTPTAMQAAAAANPSGKAVTGLVAISYGKCVPIAMPAVAAQLIVVPAPTKMLVRLNLFDMTSSPTCNLGTIAHDISYVK